MLLTRPDGFISQPYSKLARVAMHVLFRRWPAAFVHAFYEVQYREYNETRRVALGHGEIVPGLVTGEGLYASDTRFLSELRVLGEFRTVDPAEKRPVQVGAGMGTESLSPAAPSRGASRPRSATSAISS